MGNTLPRLNFNILPADVEVGVAEQKMLFIGQKPQKEQQPQEH